MTRHARVTIDADVTPRFTACYLRLAGDECAFIEAHTAHALPRLMAALADAGKRPEDVRYVVVTHAHLDHAAGASALLAACPKATLLAHPRAAKNLIDPAKLIEGATAVYGADRFRTLYGSIAPIPKERVRTLADGEKFALGDAELTAWYTAGHAYHHFIVDDPAMSSVFTGDTFGLVYPALQRHGRFALPSTSPTGFNADEARASIAKVLSLGERSVVLTHYDAYEDGAHIAAQLGRFIDRAAAWVDVEVGGGDEAPAASLELRLQAEWWTAIAEEAPWLTADDQKLLALDVELNAQGLAYVIRQQRAKTTA